MDIESTHLIYWILGILAIYIPTIFGLKKPILKYVSEEKNILFSTIENFNQGITERLFKEWVSTYEKINYIKNQFMGLNKAGTCLVISLFVTFLLENSIYQEYVIILNLFNIMFGSMFGIIIFTLT